MLFFRFFCLLVEAIKKRSAKLTSIAVETRKATYKDQDQNGDLTVDTGAVSFSHVLIISIRPLTRTTQSLPALCYKLHNVFSFSVKI